MSGNNEEYEEFKRLVREAESDMTYSHDGPITQFVLIGRAVELARNGRYDIGDKDLASMNVSDIVAEALDNLLNELYREENAQ